MRTTVDLDAAVLRELKRLQKQEGKSLGRLVSDLVAQALAHRRRAVEEPEAFHWIGRPMRARVDLADKDAVHSVLDRETGGDLSPGASS
jgi:hypothetical protein